MGWYVKEGNELHVLSAKIAKSLLGIFRTNLQRIASIGNRTIGRCG